MVGGVLICWWQCCGTPVRRGCALHGTDRRAAITARASIDILQRLQERDGKSFIKQLVRVRRQLSRFNQPVRSPAIKRRVRRRQDRGGHIKTRFDCGQEPAKVQDRMRLFSWHRPVGGQVILQHLMLAFHRRDDPFGRQFVDHPRKRLKKMRVHKTKSQAHKSNYRSINDFYVEDWKSPKPPFFHGGFPAPSNLSCWWLIVGGWMRRRKPSAKFGGARMPGAMI